MSLSPIRIYILDDHPLVCEWLVNLLRTERDIEVIGVADTAEKAISEINTLKPDIAIIDLSLKLGSGLDVIKAIRSSQLSTRTVVLSMYEEFSDIDRAMRAGARGYVMKHEATGQILTAIHAVHSGRIYAAPAILQRMAERRLNNVNEAVLEDLEGLSDREREVLRRLGSGHKTRRIADDLGVTLKTVQTYCARIKEKLGLNDEMELLKKAIHLHSSEYL